MSHKIVPHYQNGRFSNHEDEKRNSIFLRSVFMYCAGWRIRNHGLAELAQWHGDSHSQHAAVTSEVAQTNTHSITHSVTWIGHASFLIKCGDYTIITDPVFNDLTMLFKRIQKPGIARDALPRIDAVLISHNHRDHMERETLQYIAQKFPEAVFLVPKGDNYWLQKWKISQGKELSWWEDYTITRPGQEALKLIFLPAHHWSQRSLFDMNRSLWGSWMIEHAGKRCYFAGDTAYSSHFQSIAKEFSDINCVLMPIGPCEPNQWLKQSHINAEEAGRAFLELGAKTLVPMHWGTYKFGMDRPMLPLERLLAWWEQVEKAERVLQPLKIGASTILT